MFSALLRRYPVPVAYLAVLGAMYAVVTPLLSASDHRFFLGWASTNLANLTNRPVSTLVVSAFVSEETMLLWIVLTSTGLVLLVRRFGNLRAAFLVIIAHIAGTLVSEGITAVRISVGAAPQAIRHAIDVGPSYVTVSALVAVVCYGRGLWQRAVALGGCLVLAPFLFEGITGFDIAAVGHVVSMLAGVLVGAVFVRYHPRDHSVAGRSATAASVDAGF
jgi:hypothetical protein